MAYVVTEPADTTKIRNLGVVIRPNWLAIQNAESTFKPVAINFNNRTPLGIGVDPAAIANTYLLYCKQDASGNPQLYGKDQASRVTQISVSVSPLSAQNGYSWLAGGMLLQWGVAFANGTADTTIAFPVAFSAAPYSIQIGFYRASGATTAILPFHVSSSTAPTAANFTVWNQQGGHNFFWMAIGPKV